MFNKTRIYLLEGWETAKGTLCAGCVLPSWFKTTIVRGVVRWILATQVNGNKQNWS